MDITLIKGLGKRLYLKVVIENNNKSFNRPCGIYRESLDKYAPLQKKYIRGCHSPFTNQMRNKEIMRILRSKNKFLRNKSG